MRMWMMTFFLLVTATTGLWADMTVSTFEQELIPHAPTDQDGMGRAAKRRHNRRCCKQTDGVPHAEAE